MMSLRARFVSSIAVAVSAFLLVPAAAQAATHPVQVSGAELKSALLPTSTFGSGFKLLGATSSGKSLLHQKATKHVPTMSCLNFEFQGPARYGESSYAASVIMNNSNPTSLSNFNLLYDQTVYQFPSAKTAAAFYSQVYAKYASCKSFSLGVQGSPDGSGVITLKSVATTKVGTHRAFKVAQGTNDPGLSDGLALNFETLVTVAGADVFVVLDFTTANRPLPAKTMLKLVTRVKALR